MGEWDLYCFICGAGFSNYDLVNGEEEALDTDGEAESTEGPPQEGNDQSGVKGNLTDGPELLTWPLAQDAVGWIERLRIIGENPTARGIRRCYISGVGRTDMYGSVNVGKGDDPNAPESERGTDRLNIVCYHDFETDGENAALPAHNGCFKVLHKAYESAWTAGSPPQIDWDVFLEAVACKRKIYQCALTVNYGVPWDVGEQFWVSNEGDEVCVAGILKCIC